jgi:hypothetical protein
MSETSAYLPVIAAAMKLMVACQRADGMIYVDPDTYPVIPAYVEKALREMEDVVQRVEARGHAESTQEREDRIAQRANEVRPRVSMTPGQMKTLRQAGRIGWRHA